MSERTSHHRHALDGSRRKGRRDLVWLLLLPIVALLMYRWGSPNLPLSPRGENVPQLSLIYALRRLWLIGDGLRGWNPLYLGGIPTVTDRVNHLHMALAGASICSGLSPEWVLKITQYAMAILGAVGAYYLAKTLGWRRTPALVAAIAFVAFPARVALTVESIFVSCAWAGLPWAFRGYERARSSAASPCLLGARWGCSLAWIALTGPQWLLLMASPAALYIAMREGVNLLARPARARAQATAQVRLLPEAALWAGLAAAGLGAFYYIPAIAESRHLWSSQYMDTFPGSARWPLSPTLLWHILSSRWRPDFGPYDWDMARIVPNISWYLGVVLVGLSGIGLVNRRRWRIVVPLAVTLLACLLLVAGPTVPHNPVYALVRRVPLVSDSVRNAFRYLWPASLCLALLAASGCEVLSHSLRRVLRRRDREWLVAAVVSVSLLVDTWPLAQAYGTVTDGGSYLSAGAIAALRYVEGASAAGRYWVPFALERPGQHYAETSYGVRYTGRASINDDEYHSPSAPSRATLLFREGLRGEIESPGGLSNVAQAILDLSNTRFVLLPTEPTTYARATEGLLGSGRYRIALDAGDAVLIENLGAHPTAVPYAAGIDLSGAPDSDVLERLALAADRGYALVEFPAEARDLREACAATLPHGLVAVDEIEADAAPVPHPDVSLRTSRPHAGEITIEYAARDPFLLVVAETWYPHWQARVDKRPAPVLRANGTFLGVLVTPQTAGDIIFGTVALLYRRPWYQWLGYAISSVTTLALLISVVCVVIGRRCSRDR